MRKCEFHPWRPLVAIAIAAVMAAGTATAQSPYDYYYDGGYYGDGVYDDDWYYDYYDYNDDWQDEYAQGEYDELEYEADEGLHEEEWYDPSDWFDTGSGISYEDESYENEGDWYQDEGVYDDDYYEEDVF